MFSYYLSNLSNSLVDESVREFCNVLRYRPMIPVIILSRSLLECRVLVEIARMKAAKKKNGKKALDQPSSYYDKLMPHGSFSIGFYEMIEDTTSNAFKNRLSTSINDILQDVNSKSNRQHLKKIK